MSEPLGGARAARARDVLGDIAGALRSVEPEATDLATGSADAATFLADYAATTGDDAATARDGAHKTRGAAIPARPQGSSLYGGLTGIAGMGIPA